MIKNWIVRLRVITQKNALLFASFKRHKVKDASISSVYNIIFKQKNKSEVVELKQVGKVYDNGFRAINNFNLVIQPGEFISFLGPSGCGKTTILRMIAGLEYISEGTLKQGDVILNSALPQERSLSMVFQNYALYPYMNVFQNIAFGLKLATFNNPISKHLLDQYKILKILFLLIQIMWRFKLEN